jgi:predicted phage tail component-like protein
MINTLEFAKVKLHEIVKISKINTSILPPRSNFTKSTPMNNGSIYVGYKYGERLFSVDINIPSKSKEELEKTVRELAYVLDVKKPSSLIINNSNIVYYAVVEGDTDLSKLYTTGSATIKFVCYDPMGYDKDYTCIEMDNNTFRFNDMGTYNSYPVVGLTFSKPSSFAYLVNEKGQALLVGQTKDNTNSETIQENPIVLSDACTDSSLFTSGGLNTVSDNRVVGGNYGVGNAGNSIVATSYGTDVENKWIGPTFRKNINKNLSEFEVKINMSFSSKGRNFEGWSSGNLVRVSKQSGTYLHQKESLDSTILTLIPYGTDLNYIQMGTKGTCKVSYGGYTGWIDVKHIWRITLNNKYSKSTEYADDQMGLIEALGYDSNGQLLFRFHIRDNNKYFEHVIPEIYIKDTRYLGGSNTIPNPNTIATKDDEGRPTGSEPIASGAYGDWNDYIGTFTIRRKKLSNGKYRWWGKISRTEDGLNVSQEIHMGSGIINDSLPTGNLNHIVFYIAKYDKTTPVTSMMINHITVKDISNEDGELNENLNVNRDIFQKDDVLEIDFEKCEVTLNGDDFKHKLDIGSTFYNVEKNSRIIVKSDDENLTGTCSYRKLYL